MARTDTLPHFLTDVADAIRAKAGTSETIQASSFDTAIANIPSGGGAVVSNDVNFYDYDGTITNSYTKAEFLALESLPPNPSHTGLVAKGWNWTLQEAKTYLATEDFLDIGQIYNTDDDKTRIYVTIGQNQLTPYISLNINGTATIDWGDNTATSTITGNNVAYTNGVGHTYASAGDYVIKISLSTGASCAIKGTNSSTSYLFYHQGSSNTYDYTYGACVKKIEIGKGMMLHEYAFRYLVNLESVTLPDDLQIYPSGNRYQIFAYTNSLKHVNFPRTFTYFPNNTFYYSRGIRTLSIAPTTTDINATIFNYADNVIRVSAPNSVTNLGANAFTSKSLAKIHIPNQLTSIPNQACQSTAIKSIIIPSGATTLGNSVFSDCSFLESITLPTGLTTIGSSVFSNCFALRELTIPSRVTAIQSSFCYYCYNLEKIVFLGDIASIGDSAFRYCGGLHLMDFTNCTAVPTAGSNFVTNLNSDCKIVVPDSLYSTWIATSGWSTLSSYIVKGSDYNA